MSQLDLSRKNNIAIDDLISTTLSFTIEDMRICSEVYLSSCSSEIDRAREEARKTIESMYLTESYMSTSTAIWDLARKCSGHDASSAATFDEAWNSLWDDTWCLVSNMLLAIYGRDLLHPRTYHTLSEPWFRAISFRAASHDRTRAASIEAISTERRRGFDRRSADRRSTIGKVQHLYT